MQYFSLRMRLCFMKGKSTRAVRAESFDSIPLICELQVYMIIHKFQSFLPPHSPFPRKEGGYCVMGIGALFSRFLSPSLLSGRMYHCFRQVYDVKSVSQPDIDALFGNNY
jgi:hypothetical protein